MTDKSLKELLLDIATAIYTGGSGGSVLYTLSGSGSTATLTGTDGSTSTATLDNTTYALSVTGTTLVLTPSTGQPQTATIPNATTSSAGLMASADKTKLNGIETGAEANVQSDWDQSDTTADDFVKNKPTIHNVPSGGASGQVLSKVSATDYDLAWVNQTGGGGDHEELTQAEYDALTPAEKSDGTVYFVTDGLGSSVIVDDPAPIGAIQAYGGSTAPYGWLICDGAAVSRTTYSELFAVIGTTYGTGDGSTTFNLPDLKGRTIIGVGDSGATGSTNHTLGQKAGEEKHTLNGDEMPNHTHTMLYSGGSAFSWGYNYTSSGGSRSAQTEASGGVGNSGGGLPHINMQPYLVTNYIIKAKDQSQARSAILDLIDTFYPVGSYYETSDSTFDPNSLWGGTWVLETEGQVHVSAGSTYIVGRTGGEETHTLTISEMPSHTHNDGTSGSIAYAGTSGTNTAQVAFDATSGRATTATGGGLAHNNMQPYIVVNRWHRTA